MRNEKKSEYSLIAGIGVIDRTLAIRYFFQKDMEEDSETHY